MSEKQVTVSVTVTYYEPEKKGKRKIVPAFMLVGGGTYEKAGETLNFGVGPRGDTLIAYLPDDRAVLISVDDLIKAGLTLADKK